MDKRYTKEEIQRAINKFPQWLQNFNLNGVYTNPANPNYPQERWEFIDQYVAQDLSGKTVLDLGCNAGYFSIKFRERGAKVTGVDWNKDNIEQAKFVADVLGITGIEYEVANIYEFVINNTTSYDYVIFMGVFYHLRNPLIVLDKIATFTREKMYFQTILRNGPELSLPDNINGVNNSIFNESDFPRMFFIEKGLNGAHNNWWVCNESAVFAILRSSGFTNIIRSGSDCFICNVDKGNNRWKLANDLFSLKTNDKVYT
jgi:tRNA (mo5U34)-methyltransferase